VTATGLAWIETAGFRALPPIDRLVLTIMMYDPEKETDLYAAMLGDPDSAAVVRFNIPGRDFMNFWHLQRGGPWDLPAGRIAEFNRFLRGSVEVVARCNGVVENVPVKSGGFARSA
jgi:hypothetical protein